MSHVDDGALHAYLDGELSPVERERLDAHVAECAACRARLEEERGLIARATHLLGLAQPPERAVPPPPLHQLRQPRLIWRLRMPLTWAASVVLALGLGYYFGGGSAARLPSGAPDDSIPGLAAAATPDTSEPDGRQLAARSPRRAASPPQRTLEPLADRDAAKARENTVDAAAGAVAIRPQAELREATPTPVPPQAVVTRVDDDSVTLRGRLVATEWPVIRREPARQLLGADPVGVPGLAVRELRRSPAGDGVVLVEQQLDSSTVIQLFQRRVDQERPARRALAPAAVQAPRDEVSERLARFVGTLRVEIAGPLAPDSLNRLLEQVKPIP